jgi:sigma-B regulation protein RsbU (phosphoserine phosphatase)
MSSNLPELTGDRLALLYRLSQTFNASLDLDEVLDRVMDEVITATMAERGFVTLREKEGGLVFRSARGMDHTTVEEPQFQISRGVVEEVALTGIAVLTSDAQMDERFSQRQSVMSLGLRSILCAPLKLKDKILGVIYVDNRFHAGIFTKTDLELLSAIASSAAIAIENARLYQVAIEKGRIERELQMAFEVQSSLIPKETPHFLNWEFAAYWQPAREVAGDYYDFIQKENGKLGLVIADVTDKGMPAALFMALTRSIVRASFNQSKSPARAITMANRLICEDSTGDMPVTLFLCQFDSNQEEIIYVNAGHNPPLHYHAELDAFSELKRTGMALGVESQVKYNHNSQIVRAGDFIVFYTDGVIDAITPENEEFGQERFLQVLHDHCSDPPGKIISAVKEAIRDFITYNAPFDDITIVIVRRL